MTQLSENQAQEAHQLLERVHYELKKVIVGQEHLLERLLVAVIAQGHVLVEGAPGLAKTLTLRSLAKVVDVDFKRIQFTPDLLPSDLTGTRIYNPTQGGFSTELGPLFTHFVLADEINRAPAKVQSALLEAMEERQVTVGRDTYPLKIPFMVMATQNPIEHEGTYHLPEAQLDRFLFKLLVTYPDSREEMAVVQRMTAEIPPELSPILNAEQVIHLGELASKVYVDPKIMNYAVDLVQATRRDTEGSTVSSEIEKFIQYGASPRGSLALIKAAKALALRSGRNYVTPHDLTSLVNDCLRHRMILSYEGLAAGLTTDEVLNQIKATITEPKLTSV